MSAPLPLQNAIEQMLPDAEITPVALPLCPDIRLWLLSGQALERPLSADEQISVQSHPCYWAFCWASGHRLARYLLDHPEIVRGKTVIDVGCGSGVAAIAAAMAGAKRVIACDLDQDALMATRENARLSQVSLELLDDFFAWQPELDDTGEPLILAADLLYDRSNLALVDAFLERSSDVLIADSRIKDFRHPAFSTPQAYDSSNEPQSAGYDEFQTMYLYRTHP